jgi:hypothetical protein
LMSVSLKCDNSNGMKWGNRYMMVSVHSWEHYDSPNQQRLCIGQRRFIIPLYDLLGSQMWPAFLLLKYYHWRFVIFTAVTTKNAVF